MGPLGWQETVFIFFLALLIFGPKKLPELGKTVGKALTQFRRASADLKSTWDREMQSIERETAPIRESARDLVDQQIYNYDDYGYNDEFSDSSSSSSNSSETQDGSESATGAQATPAQVAEMDTAPAGSENAEPVKS